MPSSADYRMTVLMTADAVGGVWNYTLALCAALPEFGFVVAVTGPTPSPVQRAAIDRLPPAAPGGGAAGRRGWWGGPLSSLGGGGGPPQPFPRRAANG